MTVAINSGVPDPWVLRFDGTCRRNPGSGGAGAALFAPSDTVVWTCLHYLPSSSENNNTAEYTALLVGWQGAVHHGATRLLVDDDINLVLAQVRDSFVCTNRRLCRLRGRMRDELRRLDWHRITHIGRQANAQADRLANRALDLGHTVVECGPHSDDVLGCSRPLPPTPSVPSASPTPAGSVYPTLPIGPGSAPARQPRLRLRPLSEEEQETAADAFQAVVEGVASRIVDASSWGMGEGTARDARRRRCPPRVTQYAREARLDEALDDMQANQGAAPADQRAVRKARRRFGRVRASMAQHTLRQEFSKDKAKCVSKILAGASPCPPKRQPGSSNTLGSSLENSWRKVCWAMDARTLPNRRRDYSRTLIFQGCTLEFCAVLASFGPAVMEADALDGELAMDEVEDQLLRAAKASSSGHDGIGRMTFKVFCDSADGIRRCHGVVMRFLAWNGLRANPAKYASLAVTQNARGNLGS
ncbi:unnamed protein product [Peronospora belbahrii]|uniref:RNase H type-1 domain-containing protein n=1 Tax=Peronospora belbahrii TaxID=622444 RepID=A0AAU9LA38_9STRA|nr:unnamed protein product [Peronospora belbahrii]